MQHAVFGVCERRNWIAEHEAGMIKAFANIGLSAGHWQPSWTASRARKDEQTCGLAQDFMVSTPGLICLLLHWSASHFRRQTAEHKEKCVDALATIVHRFLGDLNIVFSFPCIDGSEVEGGAVNVSVAKGIVSLGDIACRATLRWWRRYTMEDNLLVSALLVLLHNIMRRPSRNQGSSVEYARRCLMPVVNLVSEQADFSIRDERWDISFATLDPLPSKKRMRRVSSAHKIDVSMSVAECETLTKVSQHLASNKIRQNAFKEAQLGLSPKAGNSFTREHCWQRLCIGAQAHDGVRHLQLALDGITAGGEQFGGHWFLCRTTSRLQAAATGTS